MTLAEEKEMKASPYWRTQMERLVNLLRGKMRRICAPYTDEVEYKMDTFADDVEFALDASSGGSLKMWQGFKLSDLVDLGRLDNDSILRGYDDVSFDISPLESRFTSAAEGQVKVTIEADGKLLRNVKARLGTNAQCSPKVFLANLIANVPSLLNMQCGQNRDQINSSAQILENLRVEKAILDGAN